ncbi:spore coat protein [Candidatus Kuenenbacteria bacterium RIFCSPLOWO2_12_FULL_42_13]|uniref:dTDP-4-dehydrorhamnose 3,5-epimerase related protein n=3 Tax=Candidatus Kueneniibacteriota TaxID=1752740 RepID=A0A0G1B4K0_9BACT|nr:MAG: dTDP-4-dehydrorhamnose 3,5-epimerase related protein [Candidatus Kuenenbacteria bacterium GW2011_GWA2_42_15]OGG92312.1 MAG: spore coat protein [Candidatus Kuenenbacteria bacterium RIFCSPLOWO2_12_FULL_42_13]OGG95678.1 MAG: spore coat protein [Candidatus Kuenenbacteria bacterium RBG_16_41_7]
MIDGVKIKELKVHQDTHKAGEEVVKTPGFLIEILRADEGLLKKFGQSIFTVAHPGTIKAFHWHKRQADLWFFASGKVIVVLHDLRPDSPTKGETQVIPAGAGDYKLILIPTGVAHGYKVLGEETAMLFYHVTEIYNPENPDEERISYDDPAIGFEWEKYK